MDTTALTEIEIAGMKIPKPQSNLYQMQPSTPADVSNTPTPDHNPFRPNAYRTDRNY